MKIGIGVTTFHRPECLELFLSQLQKFPPACEHTLHVAHNIPNIAMAKNECLHALKDCDYIFLFDDDCFPISSGWDLPFIKSGYGHLLYMNDRYGPTQHLDDVTRYRDCSGCFMFITKPVFEKVGYFNAAYGQYGFEHMGYSHRIMRLLKDWAFLCLNNTHKFIYSLDLQGTIIYKVHHNPSLTAGETITSKMQNSPVYVEEINNEKIYYDYK